MADHARDQPVGPAPRPPHAAVFFQLVDQGVNRAGLHRVAADQQRVETQRLAQFLRLDVFRHDRIDAAPRLVLRQRRRCLDHRFEIEERHGAQLHIAFVMHPGGIGQEFAVPGRIARRDAVDFRHQARFVVGVIEIDPVGPVEPVERHHRHQFDVVGHVVAAEFPQLLEAGRIGDHGRPAVEGKTVLLPEIGAAARLVAAFDHGRGDPGGLQPHRQRQPAKARPDHAGGLAGRHDCGGLRRRCRGGRQRSDGRRSHVRVSWGAASGRPGVIKAWMALLTGTGGLPIRMRALSGRVDRAA